MSFLRKMSFVKKMSFFEEIELFARNGENEILSPKKSQNKQKPPRKSPICDGPPVENGRFEKNEFSVKKQEIVQKTPLKLKKSPAKKKSPKLKVTPKKPKMCVMSKGKKCDLKLSAPKKPKKTKKIAPKMGSVKFVQIEEKYLLQYL